MRGDSQPQRRGAGASWKVRLGPQLQLGLQVPVLHELRCVESPVRSVTGDPAGGKDAGEGRGSMGGGSASGARSVHLSRLPRLTHDFLAAEPPGAAAPTATCTRSPEVTATRPSRVAVGSGMATSQGLRLSEHRSQEERGFAQLPPRRRSRRPLSRPPRLPWGPTPENDPILHCPLSLGLER